MFFLLLVCLYLLILIISLHQQIGFDIFFEYLFSVEAIENVFQFVLIEFFHREMLCQ